MLEQSQKLTDGLIIYSVLVSDYENLILRMMHLRVSVQTILIQAAKSKKKLPKSNFTVWITRCLVC